MAAKEGQKIRAKKLSPSPIQCGWETTGHALIEGAHTDQRNDTGSDRMPPGETKRGLGMAHHYRTTGRKTEASPHAGSPPLSQAGLGKNPKIGSPPGETIGLPKVDRTAQKNALSDR